MKFTSPSLPQSLAPLDNELLSNDVETVTGVLIGNAEITITSRHLSITDSRITKSDLSRAELPGLDLHNVIIEHCTMTAGKYSESSWHTVTLDTTRCSGIQLDRSTLKNVTFRGCKLDVANFRYAKLSNVVFEDCIIDEADFYGASIKNVRFSSCPINNLELQKTALVKVDFRDSTLIRVKRSSDLKGAIITNEQLVFLSPQLAQQSGIIIED
jgi:uncharacterized protein YjbI with pentapeptide repeats